MRTDPSGSFIMRTICASVPTEWKGGSSLCGSSSLRSGFSVASATILCDWSTSSISETWRGTVTASGTTTCGKTTSESSGRIGSRSAQGPLRPEVRSSLPCYSALLSQSGRGAVPTAVHGLWAERSSGSRFRSRRGSRPAHVAVEANEALERPDLDLHRVIMPGAGGKVAANTRDRQQLALDLNLDVVGLHPPRDP